MNRKETLDIVYTLTTMPSSEMKILVDIINYIFDNDFERVPEDSLDHITGDKNLILNSLFMLSTSIKLLDVCFEFELEDGKFIEIESKTITQTGETKQYFHPITNELVENYSDRIYMYWIKTKKV